MIRLVKPKIIKKGMVLVDKKTKQIYEVLSSSKKCFTVQSVYNRSRHEFTSASGLFILSIHKTVYNAETGSYMDEFVDINDFFVVLDDSDDLYYS